MHGRPVRKGSAQLTWRPIITLFGNVTVAHAFVGRQSLSLCSKVQYGATSAALSRKCKRCEKIVDAVVKSVHGEARSRVKVRA